MENYFKKVNIQMENRMEREKSIMIMANYYLKGNI